MKPIFLLQLEMALEMGMRSWIAEFVFIKQNGQYQ